MLKMLGNGIPKHEHNQNDCLFKLSGMKFDPETFLERSKDY